jgi:hypothetical protein
MDVTLSLHGDLSGTGLPRSAYLDGPSVKPIRRLPSIWSSTVSFENRLPDALGLLGKRRGL